MSLTAQRLTLRGRRKAESLMADTCTIRPVVDHETNPSDHPTDPGKVVPVYGDPVYSGKCKIQNQRLRYPETPSGGEHQFTTAVTELHLPVMADAGNVDTDHVATIDNSFNPSNVGRLLRVQTLDKKTFQTSIRCIVEEVLA